MQEGKRQKQVSAVLQQELNDIFMRLGLNMIDGGMVSISSVKVTPDLLEARVYLSLFKTENPAAVMKIVEDRAWEVKKLLADKVKHQLRRIPVMHYFQDDTLDYVFKMEDVFKRLEEERNNSASPAKETEE